MDRDLKADYISDLVTQIFLGLFVTMFIAQLVTEYIAHGKKCCCDPWNIFEAINMFFFVFYFFFTMLGGIMLNHELTTSNVDYTDVAFFYELAEWILTVNMILSVCVVFKHLRVSKRMSLLLVTFKKGKYKIQNANMDVISIFYSSLYFKTPKQVFFNPMHILTLLPHTLLLLLL